MNTFKTFQEWLECAQDAVVHLFMFIVLMLRAMFVGLTSLSFAIWRLSVRWVGKYPSIALGGFLVAAFFVWFLTFVSMRSRAVIAEDQRDSI